MNRFGQNSYFGRILGDNAIRIVAEMNYKLEVWKAACENLAIQSLRIYVERLLEYFRL